jgi:O-antigen/teichoic acid export membrane protein
MIARLMARLPPPLRAAALYALAIAWGKGLSLAMLPLLTAHLTPAEFGRLELLASVAELAALLIGAGLVETLFRFGAAPGEPARRAAAEVTGLALLLSALSLALLLAFAAPLALLLPGGAAPSEVMLLGIAVAMGPLIGVTLGWLRLSGEPAGYAAAEVLRGTAQAALVAALVLAGFGVAGVLAGGAVVAVLATLVLLVRQLRRTGIALAPPAWGRLLAYGVPLIGSGLAGFALGTADRWVLAAHVAPATLGHYALAAKIALVAAFLTQPFELWWYPQRQRVLVAPDGAARTARIVGVGGAFVVLAAAAAAIGGPLLIAAATPAAYHPAAAFVPWLAAVVALQALGSLVNVGCYTGRTGGLPLLANGIAAVVAVIGYAALIPAFGVPGTLAATLLAQAVRFGVFLALSQRRAPIAYPLARIALLAGAAVAAAAALQAATPGLGAAALGALALTALAGLALALRLVELPRRAVGMPAHV